MKKLFIHHDPSQTHKTDARDIMKNRPIPQLKRFVVRKFIMAHSAAEALTKEKEFSPDDVYIDDQWLQKKEVESEERNKTMGFKP